MRIKREILLEYKTQNGESLAEIADNSPVLLIFLRHFGWTFCREAVAEIAEKRDSLTANGTQLAFVSMAEEAKAARFFARYGVEDLPRFSDQSAKLYQAFGLQRGGASQLFAPKNFIRGFEALMKGGHTVGAPVGDVWQMPGVFLIFKDEIRKSFIHETASDKPNYEEMIKA